MLKKVNSGLIIILLLICFIHINPQLKTVSAEQQNTLFSDGFESYVAGNKPSAPWEVIYNSGISGTETVTNTQSHSGANSLVLKGPGGLANMVARRFSSSSNIIGYTVYLRIPQTTNQSGDWGVVLSFFNRETIRIDYIERFAQVSFDAGYGMWIGGNRYSYTPYIEKWTKVTAIMAKVSKTYIVYINDVLFGNFSALLPNVPSDRIGFVDALELQTGGALGHPVVETFFDDVSVFEGSPFMLTELDPYKYNPYLFLDNGAGFPWNTQSDFSLYTLYTGTYFVGDYRVIQYWFYWENDYLPWFAGLAATASPLSMDKEWLYPLRQVVKENDWEPVLVFVNKYGNIDYILVRFHYMWIRYDLTVPGASLLNPTYDGTHIKLWFAIGCHTPLSFHFYSTTPFLLNLAFTMPNPIPEPFKKLLGQAVSYANPPNYEFFTAGLSYPGEMRSWDQNLALSLGFSVNDLQYINDPTLAYSQIMFFSKPCFGLFGFSPINIQVINSKGQRVGFNPETGGIINEISGSIYSGPGTKPQTLIIPSELSTDFTLKIFGTDTREFTIMSTFMSENGLFTDVKTYSDVITQNATYIYHINLVEGKINLPIEIQLKEQLASLNIRYLSLQANFTLLQSQLAELNSTYHTLNNNYQTLQENYLTLQNDLNDLKKQYTSLSNNNNILIAITSITLFISILMTIFVFRTRRKSI